MTVDLQLGDCREVLRSLPAESVHCVVTSPPYWGLRDYGLASVLWGGDQECKHEWLDESLDVERGAGNWTQAANARELATGRHQTRFRGDTAAARANMTMARAERGACRRCGAWRGVLGIEPTPEMYVQHIVEVFREVRRMLCRDGTLWLNMGDSYASGMRASYADDRHYGAARAHDQRPPTPTGLKPKDLIGMPWRVAFALQADGWYLRSDIVWCKPSPMPESVRDRPTKAHEYLFLLTKSERYYYDAEAIAEWGTGGPGMAEQRDRIGELHQDAEDPLMGRVESHSMEGLRARRNKRSWWLIPSEPFPGAHFATFPQALVEPCILAGTSERGCCPQCGTPWVRVNGQRLPTGWNPSCRCDAAEPVPCVVLDPFVGSGTVAYVAHRLGRRAIGIDASEQYIEMARQRLAALPVGTLL